MGPADRTPSSAGRTQVKIGSADSNSDEARFEEDITDTYNIFRQLKPKSIVLNLEMHISRSLNLRSLKLCLRIKK